MLVQVVPHTSPNNSHTAKLGSTPPYVVLVGVVGSCFNVTSELPQKHNILTVGERLFLGRSTAFSSEKIQF